MQSVSRVYNFGILLAGSLALMGCVEPSHGRAESARNNEKPLHESAVPVMGAVSASHALQTRGRASENPASVLGFDYTSDAQGALALGIPSVGIASYYRALPDYLLENRAKSGEKFAMAFFVERIAMDILEFQRARRSVEHLSPDGGTGPLRNFGKMSVTLSALMQDPTNAMAGYLWGLAHSASIFGAPDEPIVAGIRLAGVRGDVRAAEFERQFRSTHPNLDEAKIKMYFDSGRRAMEMAAQPRNP
ncbi:hypothetical protein [Thermomonas hydrothermalis]|uniref:Uncharacterized protein n=1 Tax=Thermomonas hydrothermalis TaxID=213588 RepID=A0A1M4ZFN0_9GAMM|nr:hypothetical protein [Thermomonas hydrothermalis]MCL6618403.1 hypothetical protein [Thermomonas hydrothermalis]SHF16758.1 hypothetical protein SAMN02745204_01929 [Thermomonas hydrothermalis]